MENREWKEYKLSDICNIISTKTSIQNATLENYISTENMINDFGGVQNAEKLPTTNTVNSFFKDDILFSNIRTYFKKVWYAKFDGTVSQDVLTFRAKDNIIPKYLYYTLCNPEFTEYTVLTSKGAKMPRGDKDAIKNFELQLPPLPEQKAIASVLSSLDDKIDLLHQQNQTLEALAETLFRQWFIEKAKEDWPIYKFKDIVKHVKPGTNFQPKRVNNGIPFLNVKNLNNGFIDLQNNTFITQEEYERVHKNWKPEVGDVLISRIGTLGLVATILERDLPIAVHYNMINLKPKLIGTEFLYFFLKSNHFQEEYFSRARQSVQEYLAIEDVEEIEVKLPLEFESFTLKEQQFIEFYNKIKNNFIQIQTLTQLRDTLLPKLMSGEVRVKV
jgi:type I restriction enzyme S subunit